MSNQVLLLREMSQEQSWEPSQLGTLQQPAFPRLTGGSVILFASIVNRPHFWHVINRFISPNQQRSILIYVGDSDLRVATVGDAEVNNIPTDATFFELLPDGFQAALFASAAHFQVSFLCELFNYLWSAFPIIQ